MEQRQPQPQPPPPPPPQQQQQQQLLHRRRDDSGWATLGRRLMWATSHCAQHRAAAAAGHARSPLFDVLARFVACAAYSMHVTGTFNEISSAVSVMTLDQRLLLSLVLGSICAAIQAVIFPPSRHSTGVAQVGVLLWLTSRAHYRPRYPTPQITPSIALVSFVNELIFKSDSWPFGAPLPALQSLQAGKAARIV
jgi:hypothetical protein